MKAIVFDTETNGKPLNYKASMKDVDNWPRVTQLAWQKIDIDSGTVLNEYQALIKPNGWVVPTEKFFIENNMSTERCEAEGHPISDVLLLLVNDMNDSDFVVAHNMAFDLNVVSAEMIRLDIRAEKKLIKICTMEATTDFCKLPGKYGKYKWPQLMELYVKLFEKEFEGAHDAMDDVRACAACFIKLLQLKIIALP